MTLLFSNLLSSDNFFDPKDPARWHEYLQKTLIATKPSETLLLALEHFRSEGKEPGLAVDLGTGTGREALFLLKNGWKVLAIDAEPVAIDILKNRALNEDVDMAYLETDVNSFISMALPDQIDLINASHCLPFCAPEGFNHCWQTIVQHLPVNSRFSGHFFGDKDEWAATSSGTFHTRDELLKLFQESFNIEHLSVEEGFYPTALGKMKYWHIFDVVAKKIK